MPCTLSRPVGLMRALVVALGCLSLVGCGGGGGNLPDTALNDDFTTLSSSRWEVNASVCAVDGGLVLNGSLSAPAEVCSGEAYSYMSLHVAALSNTWSAGTSFGFDVTRAGKREAVIVNQGMLIIINDTATGTKLASVPITAWGTSSVTSTLYSLCWQPGKVDLYAGTKLVATYSGALVPSSALAVRFTTDSGRLTLSQIKVVSGAGAATADNTAVVDMSDWNVTKGSWAITQAGKLVLHSTALAPAEVKSKGEFLFKEMEFVAAGDWGSDSSIGYERTAGGSHYTIEVTNGQYRVSSPAGSRVDDIIGWAAARAADSSYRIKWQSGMSQLIVNAFLKSAYSGDYLAAGAAKVRFYAGTDQPGEMVVDSVLVKDAL